MFQLLLKSITTFLRITKPALSMRAVMEPDGQIQVVDSRPIPGTLVSLLMSRRGATFAKSTIWFSSSIKVPIPHTRSSISMMQLLPNERQFLSTNAKRLLLLSATEKKGNLSC